MKFRTILSITSAAMALLILGTVPCMAAETAKSRWETIPTEDCTLNAYTNVKDSPLYGKSAVFFGDSLCNASGESNSTDATVKAKAGYAGRIGTKYRMDYYKRGVSGSAYSVRNSRIGTAIDDFRLMNPDLDCDYVILQGGVNDAWDSAPVGTVSDGFEPKDFESGTFAGSIERVLYKVQENFPNATVGFIIVYKMPNAFYNNEVVTGLRGENMKPYVDVIKEACQKWRVPYLDFYNDEAFNNDVFKVTTTTCLSGDGIHMSSHGYDVISPYIAAWMEAISPQKQSEPIDSEPIDSEPLESESDTSENEPDTSDTQATTDGNNGQTEPTKKPKTGLIIGIACGAAIVVAGAITAAILGKKRKK